MSELKEAAEYSHAELQQLCVYSPAVQTYLNSPSPTDESSKLRNLRNQSWTKAALASLVGADPLTVCRYWSEQADWLLQQAYLQTFKNLNVALFALGKLGSQDLNLSSDVDILLICQEESLEITTALRHFKNLLNERTAFGFVFRVDFDLRPGGRNGPLVPTIDQFKDYYGNYGETWERMALVRLRYICGDADIRQLTLDFAKRFTYRRHLDFTLLEDLKGLRQKIHEHYWQRSQANSIDLKLGVGGIRDIELFVHALQVVNGGRDQELQVASTQRAFDVLDKKNILPHTDIEFLKNHYWNLRQLENYVQALRDEQTHILHLDQTHPQFVQDLIGELVQKNAQCSLLVGELIGKPPEKNQQIMNLQEMSELSGIEPAILEDHWQSILEQKVISRFKQKDEEIRLQFLREFLIALKAQNGNAQNALINLRDFLHATKAKSSFFSLLTRNPQLLQELAWLFGHSPYLAKILCNRPELLDSFVYRSQDELSPDWDVLLEQLSEKKLLSEIINGSQFFRDKNLLNLLKNLSSTADQVVTCLLNKLNAEFATQLNILALGKWGGQEMGFRSDLDFIFVSPLSVSSDQEFKVARRLISRLTDLHRGGSLYSIDMRLRPSGKAGPLVITIADLKSYLLENAQTWERQAYLKSRWLLPNSVSLQALCISKSLKSEELLELEEIRKSLANKASDLDLKYSPGGLIDIEFAMQIICLQKQIPETQPQTLSMIQSALAQNPVHSQKLQQNYDRLRQIEQMLQLVTSQPGSRLEQNHESFQFLAKALQADTNALASEVRSLFSENLQILNELDPRR